MLLVLLEPVDVYDPSLVIDDNATTVLFPSLVVDFTLLRYKSAIYLPRLYCPIVSISELRIPHVVLATLVVSFSSGIESRELILHLTYLIHDALINGLLVKVLIASYFYTR